MPKWCAKNALDKYLSSNKTLPIHNQIKYKDGDKITSDVWYQTMVQAAELVQDLGHKYIELFERAEREYKKSLHSLHTFDRINSLLISKSNNRFLTPIFKENCHTQCNTISNTAGIEKSVRD